MAQLVEHIVHIDGVTGSSPVATTTIPVLHFEGLGFFYPQTGDNPLSSDDKPIVIASSSIETSRIYKGCFLQKQACTHFCAHLGFAGLHLIFISIPCRHTRKDVNLMANFVSREKLSKKTRKELDNQKRSVWARPVPEGTGHLFYNRRSLFSIVRSLGKQSNPEAKGAGQCILIMTLIWAGSRFHI